MVRMAITLRFCREIDRKKERGTKFQKLISILEQIRMAPSFNDRNSLFKFVVEDGNGVKGMVDSGLTEVPDRYVQPLHERIQKQDATTLHLPPIDLSKLDGPDRNRVAEDIAVAAETLGFFQVINHGVPVEILESLKEAAHNFFSQPSANKAKYLKGVSPTPLVMYGTSFSPHHENVLEWKDHISMRYSTDEDALAFWPQQCRDVTLEYLKASMKMVRKLLEILIEKLGVSVDDNSKLEALIGMKTVNMNFYPTCPSPELTVGVGRHSDMGTLTVLLQDGIGGLYVKVEEDSVAANAKKGQWLEIPPFPGALVINIGDTLQILSNGRYKSAEHRVRTTSTSNRVSVPIFTVPKPKEKIGPLPELVERDGFTLYREFVFEDYMDNFFNHAHDGKKSLDFALLQ